MGLNDELLDHGTSAETQLASLIELVVTKDQQALAKLYELTVNRVYALAVRIVGDESRAYEVVSDVYYQVWMRADSFDADRGTVIAWLMIQARSRAIDSIRKARRTVSHQTIENDEYPDQGRSPELLVQSLQQGSVLAAALSSLSESQRQLISLAYFKGFSHAELVQYTGMPLGTVKSHIRRGLTNLRTQLKDQLQPDHTDARETGAS